MTEPVEWDCEGCGVHVFAFGCEAPPVSGFCAVCAWLCEFVPDPEEMVTMRARLTAAEGDWRR